MYKYNELLDKLKYFCNKFINTRDLLNYGKAVECGLAYILFSNIYLQFKDDMYVTAEQSSEDIEDKIDIHVNNSMKINVKSVSDKRKNSGNYSGPTEAALGKITHLCFVRNCEITDKYIKFPNFCYLIDVNSYKNIIKNLKNEGGWHRISYDLIEKDKYSYPINLSNNKSIIFENKNIENDRALF